jgi:hypothetical protein
MKGTRHQQGYLYRKGSLWLPEEKEAEALEDALYTLRAFRTAWQHRDPRDSSMWL